MPTKKSESTKKYQELRLFPLNLVLFPGMILPLRIFEERYKLMIGECIDNNLPFGVVLIKEGQEVGGSAIPYQIGTTALIIKVERMDGGGYYIESKGGTRFRIHDISQETPFLIGSVEFLKEDKSGRLKVLSRNTARLLSQLWRLQSGLDGGWTSSPSVPQDPVALSYAVSQSMARPPLVGQYLLQIPVKERLEWSIPLITERIAETKDQLRAKFLKNHGRLN